MKTRQTPRKEHKNRDDLTGEHTLGDAGQIILVFLFCTVWILDTFVFRYTTFLNHHVSPIIRIFLGIMILVPSAILAKRGISIVFGEKRDTPGVIRKGIFNLVRHPIYLSEILLYFGLLILSISLAAAVVWILAIGVLHYISRHEEKLLLERFGIEYEQYIKEVPMWIPRLRKK